jgi:hypothetical protein
MKREVRRDVIVVVKRVKLKLVFKSWGRTRSGKLSALMIYEDT